MSPKSKLEGKSTPPFSFGACDHLETRPVQGLGTGRPQSARTLSKQASQPLFPGSTSRQSSTIRGMPQSGWRMAVLQTLEPAAGDVKSVKPRSEEHTSE